MPVINENDTVATTEIRFGDNDRLAARVAAMMNADALVLLSDIDGLYTADPRNRRRRRHSSPRVRDLTPEIEAMAGDPPPGYSSGGMVTKLAAARIAIAAGCRMAIADGDRLTIPWPPSRAPRLHLVPAAAASPLTARKRWIAGALKPVGTVHRSTTARPRPGPRQEPAAGRGHRRSRAASSAATRWRCATATGR